MPGGEMVSHCPLEARFLVRAQAGQFRRQQSLSWHEAYLRSGASTVSKNGLIDLSIERINQPYDFRAMFILRKR